MLPWSLTSWQTKTMDQEIKYPCEQARDSIITELQGLPPLVTPSEIEELKSQLAAAARGDAFLLQGGDCAESFADCQPQVIVNKIRILLQISSLLFQGLKKPIVRVGRIAGQYAKPRSSEYEIINGQKLLSYRGDLINGAEFDERARIPDPKRMLRGYQYAVSTINFIRSLMSAPTDFYVSHEALNLYYEQALTRCDESGKWYNVSTHYPWIGMRTTNLDSAHIEYIRGIANPIAIKIGPGMTPSLLIKLVELLNPENIVGKLTLVHRFGSTYISDHLPPLIQAVKTSGFDVLWSCDPMHGNTTLTPEGYKTRRFDIILSELEQAISIHQSCNSNLGGVHFELTGDEVTECLGGARGLTEENLKEAYRTLVDPRLNYDQALEMAMCLVGCANS